jgi:hypothetical protein
MGFNSAFKGLMGTVRHRCLRSQFKGNLSELNPKLAIWRELPKMEAQAHSSKKTVQNGCTSCSLKWYYSGQTDKLTIHKFPFQMSTRSSYERKSFKTEAKFIEGSTCFERHTAHHQELWTLFAASGLHTHVVTGCFSLSLGNDWSPHGYINQRLQIQFGAPDDERCTARNIQPWINFGIISSITKLHLVGISTEPSTMHGSMNIKFITIYRKSLRM